VSKRTRGSARTQHHRPGTRPASGRSSAGRQRETALAPASPLEAAPIIAEDLAIAEGLAEERPAATRAEVERVARATGTRHRIKAGSLLAARAATEYLYVARDMRRIVFVAALLFGTLFTLWALIVVMRVFPLSFY
jgi:hypothetical protein